jgi:hypothetical protein
MHKPLNERWAEYHVLGANRYLPPVLFGVALVFVALAILQQSRELAECAVLLLLGAFQSWERVGVYNMLKRARFNWDSIRA